MAKFDISTLTKSTEINAYLKREIATICYNALAEKLGADVTRFLDFEIEVQPDDDTSITIKKNAVVAECADTKDKDGFDVGIIAQIDVTIKKWNPTYTKKDGITHSAATLPDIDTAIEAAEKKAKEDAEKKSAAAKAKEKKIAADTARREKRKAKGV